MAQILVVDDDLDIQLLLRLELSAEGHEVDVASNGQEALDAIAALKPELVLLDVMMPVLDGWGVLEALEPRPEPPIIMVSAFASEHGSVFRRALGLGAHDFVQKPFNPDRLHELIRRALAMSPEQRAEHRHQQLLDLDPGHS